MSARREAWIKRNIQAVHYYITAQGSAHKLIKEFAPDIAIGTGGYVCAPVLAAAAQMGVKTAVHESNSLPGMTTTMLAHRVDKVLCANEDVLTHLKHTENCVVTGNPLRSNIPIEDRDDARKKLGLPEGMTIVSFGGSLGANKKTGERFIAKEYIDNMYTCLSAADLIISRAGAMTLTELKAAGRASILIPFPQAAENHQYYNALTMSKNGAAILIEDKDLTAERLLTEVKALYEDRERLAGMEKAAAALNIPNATDLVVGNILDLIKDRPL